MAVSCATMPCLHSQITRTAARRGQRAAFTAFSSAAGSDHRRVRRVVTKPISLEPKWCLNRNAAISRSPLTRLQASKDESPVPTNNDGNNTLLSVGLLAAYVVLASYAFFLSPNQTPTRDIYFLEKLVGVTQDTYQLNPVFYALFQLMGVWPGIFACLLVPAARSENKVPAWPFVTLSFLFGAFALLPYMILWQPLKEPAALPPPKEELEGWNKLWMKGAETVVLPGLLLAGGASMVYLAVTASPAAWNQYFQYFNESRMTHATTIDFCILCTLAPFWMWNDAEMRKWEPRDKLVPLFSVLPVIGPAIYLVLRPKASKNGFTF